MRRSGLEARRSNRESFVAKAIVNDLGEFARMKGFLDEIHAVTQIKVPGHLFGAITAGVDDF